MNHLVDMPIALPIAPLAPPNYLWMHPYSFGFEVIVS